MLQLNHSVPTSLRAVLIASLLFSGLATAAEEPRIELTPLFGTQADGQFKHSVTGETIKLNSASPFAVALNWRAGEPGTQYELFYSRQSTETDAVPATPFKVEYLQVGGTTIIGEAESRVVPFAVGGIGATRFSPGLDGLSQETRFSLNLGGGVHVPLVKHVRLRLEARGHLTWLGGNTDLFCDSGCTVVAKRRTFFQYAALAGVSVSF